MRVLKYIVAAAIVLMLALPAWADDLQVIVDPSPTPPPYFYVISGGSAPVSVSWEPCASGVPAGDPAIYNSAACLYFYNSGPTIYDLNLTFTVPMTEPSYDLTAFTAITCTIIDSSFAGATCPGSVTPGETVTLSFYGGSGIPTGFFAIGENDGGCLATATTTCSGVAPGDMPGGAALVPTYDPSTMVLLLVGMSMLAVVGIRRVA